MGAYDDILTSSGLILLETGNLYVGLNKANETCYEETRFKSLPECLRMYIKCNHNFT